jgi:hypothetical protein
MIHGARKALMGIKIGKKLRFWSNKIIADYNEDYYLPEEESSEVLSQSKSKEIGVNGPMCRLFPLILKQMIEEPTELMQQGYIPALMENMITPSNYNVLHYYSFENRSLSVKNALKQGIKYQRDSF